MLPALAQLENRKTIANGDVGASTEGVGVAFLPSGALQVSHCGTFQDDCTARLPSLNLDDADKRADKSLTLALVQRIDLNHPQHDIVALGTADLPALVNNTPQWILKLDSTLMVARQGWLIEPIAILGNPQ